MTATLTIGIAFALAAFMLIRAIVRECEENPPVLTAKGERWLTRAYKTAVITSCMAAFTLICAFVGGMEYPQ